ncbi:ATP-dependent helicase [Candidatus Pacearchaeota archaeon CG_4_9_14_0_2_um_filter_39_13]|nr:DEAD/DEAH box helicase [Candidatus Pacearchaeota archaeon]OIO42661.1 MAG: hypothetical protein AUJ64_03765 [Candidatus Pacearchaeota archaeon CG1_02_39_14]PJC44578.1 MAG: ATP-dependent helicase [Candidatus Pacearchaeota archaeon CG_4_9_14_0_2_um_filter_39_13]
MKTFEELGLSEKLLRKVKSLGFESPTEIQEKSIPLVLHGKDLIGTSATGSGKTLAFGLGLIEKIQEKKGVQVLVLTPTRELAGQITKVFHSITQDYPIRVCEVYGGVPMDRQIDNMGKSEIIIATPGRILDHLKRRNVRLTMLKTLILDEADRMADMGFLQDVKEILKYCPEERQTLLFTATLSPDINYIAKNYMKAPVTISVESYVDPSKLQQHYYDVPKNMKFSLLVHLLKNENSKLVMIFCNTRIHTDMLAKNLEKNGLDAMAIHGGLDQKKRIRLMKEFHRGDIKILVCTDVAARGLDIKGISHVYNYDIPKTPSEYIHRIGRTARAGKEGMAISIVSNNDYDNFRRLTENESLKIKEIKMPQVESIRVNFTRSDDREGFGRSRDSSDRRSSSGFRRSSSGFRGSGRGDRGSRGDSRGSRRDSRGSRRSSGFRRSGNPRRY